MKNILKSILIIFFCILSIHKNFSQGFSWAQGIIGTNEVLVGSLSFDRGGNIYSNWRFSGSADFDPGIGTYNLSAVGYRNMVLVKEDAQGNFIWAKHFPGLPSASLVSFLNGGTPAFDKNNNIYLGGSFRETFDFDPGPNIQQLTSAINNSDGFILKLDSAGNFVWVKQIPNFSIQNLRIDKQNRIFISGHFSGQIDADPGPGMANFTSNSVTPYTDILLAKFDTNGNFLWGKQIAGIDDKKAISLIVDTISNIFISGQFKSIVDFDPSSSISNLNSLGNYDIFIAKYDSSGNYLWAKGIGSAAYDDIAQGIDVDRWGNVAVTGYFNGTVDFDPGPGVHNLVASSRDFFTLRLRNNGDFSWAKSTSSPGNDNGQAIVTDSMGNVYTAGGLLNMGDLDPGPGVFMLSGPFVQKLDSAGNFVWAVNVSGSWIGLDHDESIYLTGSFTTTQDFDPGPGIYNMTGTLAGSGYIVKLCVSQPVGLMADTISVCAGDTIILSTPVPNGTNYYWKRNGTLLSGNNSDTLKAGTSGTYSVTVYGVGCPAESNPVTVTVTPKTKPTINVAVAPLGATIGLPVTLTANLSNTGGHPYTIEWFNMGIPFDTTTIPSVTYIKPAGTDQIRAIIKLNYYCSDTAMSPVKTVIGTPNSVYESILAQGIEVYPNPFENAINVKGLKSNDKIILADITGRIVYSFSTNETSLQIETNHISQGWYVLKIVNEEGRTRVNMPVVKL